ncbi:hypothetical protein PR202_ga08116 [Eleusine coracana subsp. coracana]|uniref:Uncharacterized protein n=1 Tax=Eleusine coracana subsp. coracana TaxID=191504 RepID=A0AAV5C0H3_ELECO|nr:hypothetical protein PR202_ga08116 [Eleusine coracana subsp. coracana]
MLKEGGWRHTVQATLAGRGGNVVSCDRVPPDVVSCDRVPPDVRAYYLRQLDRTADKKERQRESLRREEIAAEGNVIYDVNDDNDDELHAALRASREDAEYRRSVSRRGGQYEHDGGSSQPQGGGVFGMLKRSVSLKEKRCKEADRAN